MSCASGIGYPTVICRTDGYCPSDSEVTRALASEADVFSAHGIAIDPAPSLVIEWWPPAHLFAVSRDDGPGLASGVTRGRDRVYVNGWAALAHERMHVHYAAMAGNGDANHEEWPGPWTALTNDLIEIAGDEMRAAVAEGEGE